MPHLTLTADVVPNRFLSGKDWLDPRYAALREDFAVFYRDVMHGEPNPTHSKYPDCVVTQWSREWEYPWAVLNGDLAPGMRIIDLGCGGSPLMPYLSREFGCVATGVDTNFCSPTGRNNLEGFATDPARLFPEVTWLCEDMSGLTLEDASADRVFCISVLEHVTRATAEQSLQQIERVLKPAGMALITLDLDGPHRRLDMNFLELIETAARAGLVLRGRLDMTPPRDSPGTYDVAGFVLHKRAA
jgi:SAM-dependent methyltransferase